MMNWSVYQDNTRTNPTKEKKVGHEGIVKWDSLANGHSTHFYGAWSIFIGRNGVALLTDQDNRRCRVIRHGTARHNKAQQRKARQGTGFRAPGCYLTPFLVTSVVTKCSDQKKKDLKRFALSP